MGVEIWGGNLKYSLRLKKTNIPFYHCSKSSMFKSDQDYRKKTTYIYGMNEISDIYGSQELLLRTHIPASPPPYTMVSPPCTT
jgi:hypothetical protein